MNQRSVKSNRYDHISDAELLALYEKDRNQEWIGILLERYTLLLLGVCMKYLKNEHEARDCVQQVFFESAYGSGQVQNRILQVMALYGSKKPLPDAVEGKRCKKHERTPRTAS